MQQQKLLTTLKRIGLALKGLRLKKGYNTLSNFSEKYDLPMIQYWRIENGKANITIKTLSHLLAIHKMTIEDFFCFLDEANM